MTGARAPQPSSASERRKLIEEYEEAKRSEADRFSREQIQELRRKRLVRPVLATIVLIVLSYLAVNPPSWLLPPQIPTPTLAERDASLRFAVYLQAQQIERFRAVRGRLPATLTDLGEPLPGVGYEVVSATAYTLRSMTDSSIRYHSAESLDGFLGNSLSLLGPIP